jgi:ubiquinone/menaquinone biosynthesis C-methylase UbiE
MLLRASIAKFLMNLAPSKYTYDISIPCSETINHKNFIDAIEAEKRAILFEMARSHYSEDQLKPFDHYYPNCSLKSLLAGKRVLDLGCWCGGKSVSYAERWNVKSMHGIDVNKYFIEAAILFSSTRQNTDINYDFTVAVAEALPYRDDYFDAIVSWDVLEHVQSLKATLAECKRTLKSGGMLLSVFPSYYDPFGAHLDSVSKMPCLQWFFSPKTLNIAYHEIMKSRGEEAYWYRHKDIEQDDWSTLQGGIGINGTTILKFKSVAVDVGFRKVDILPTPLFSVGGMSIRHPHIKVISKLLKPLLKIEALQDYLSHCIVSILVT